MIRSGERSVAEVSRELGVARSVVPGWVDEAVETEAGPVASDESAADELRRLRRKNELLRGEAEILWKAREFFAREQAQRNLQAPGDGTQRGSEAP